MEIKKENNSIVIPGWVIATGIATIGTIVADICKTISQTRMNK